MKLDYGKLASGIKLSSEKKSDAAAPDEDETEPKSLGDRLIAAIDAKNGDAIEECIRQIAGK